ncbi:MAG: MarR family winged helix-turn-helix transcriptional regulator [Actinomycetales bacterium]
MPERATADATDSMPAAGGHTTPEPTAPPGGADPEVVRALQQELIQFNRSVHLIKQSNTSASVPPGAVPLLARLVTDGPKRSSALAELACLDPSTVSRQVDQLVKNGLVRRTADPDDGRATLLEATDQGRSELSAYGQRIGDLLAAVLQDWTPDQVETLTVSLRRLNEDAARRLPSLLDRMRQTAR